MSAGHFSGDAHAFAAGAIFAAIHLQAERPESLIESATPVLDKDNNYKPMLTVEMFGRQFRVIVAEIE